MVKILGTISVRMTERIARRDAKGRRQGLFGTRHPAYPPAGSTDEPGRIGALRYGTEERRGRNEEQWTAHDGRLAAEQRVLEDVVDNAPKDLEAPSARLASRPYYLLLGVMALLDFSAYYIVFQVLGTSALENAALAAPTAIIIVAAAHFTGSAIVLKRFLYGAVVTIAFVMVTFVGLAVLRAEFFRISGVLQQGIALSPLMVTLAVAFITVLSYLVATLAAFFHQLTPAQEMAHAVAHARKRLPECIEERVAIWKRFRARDEQLCDIMNTHAAAYEADNSANRARDDQAGWYQAFEPMTAARGPFAAMPNFERARPHPDDSEGLLNGNRSGGELLVWDQLAL